MECIGADEGKVLLIMVKKDVVFGDEVDELMGIEGFYGGM